MQFNPDLFLCPINGCDWSHTAPPIAIPEDATPDDTASLAAAGQARTAGIEAAMTEHFTNGHTIVEWVNEVSSLRQALMNQPQSLLCLGCFVDRHNAGRRGEPLPPQNQAALVVNGGAQCLNHVKIQDGPIVPGLASNGLFLPGGPVPPQNGG